MAHHLSPEELLDFAESTGRKNEGDHLASCSACQHQLTQLQTVMATVSEAAGRDVPEPSPLFWEHFSARVHEAVSNEEPRRWPLPWVRLKPDTTSLFWSRAGALSAIVAVAVIVTVMVASRQSRPPVSTTNESAALLNGDSGTDASVPVANIVDDPSFGVVSDLTGDMDVETAMAAGLASEGSAEHAVLHMTSGELLELQRLLKDQMSVSQKS